VKLFRRGSFSSAKVLDLKYDVKWATADLDEVKPH